MVEININEILKKNNITQKEFAEYLGMTREALNTNINHGKQRNGMINNLKLFVAKKRGIIFDIEI